MKIYCRAICFNLIALFFAVHLVTLGAVPEKVYPTATLQEEFDLQVENLLRATVAIGDGFGGPYDRELGDRTRRDDRNWERALARIIREPAKYGFPLGEQAICVAELRGTLRNEMIVSASEIYFDEIVTDAIKKHAEFQSLGESVPNHVSGKVNGMISRLLRFHDPRMLHVILRHLNSNEAVTLGTLDAFAIKQIPDELRSCGDASHRDEAINLANRLRDAGRGGEADGIERWALRSGDSERGSGRQANRGSFGAPSHSSDQSDNNFKGKESVKIFWWSILSVIGFIVIAIGMFAWRCLCARPDSNER